MAKGPYFVGSESIFQAFAGFSDFPGPWKQYNMMTIQRLLKGEFKF